MSEEPGLDRHDWETEWAELEPEIADSPYEALPEVDALVERIMLERGYPISEQEADARALDQPEVLFEFLQAREVARRVDQGEDVDPGDVGQAITGYRNLYAFLVRQTETA